MTTYVDVLGELHRSRRPRTYLEIGVQRGDTLRLAHDDTLCVGVDPQPELPHADAVRYRVQSMTSDAFFASTLPRELFGDLPVDLAFIDGMHLFEFALRDFVSIEALSGPESIVVIHDCLPRDVETSTRDRTTEFWTGDVWKLLLCLLDHRPGLSLTVLRVPPSGLCLVRGLDPEDRTLGDAYDEFVADYLSAGFAVWQERRADVLQRTAGTVEDQLWSLRGDVTALESRLREAGSREAALREALAAAQADIEALEEQTRRIAGSASWRLTAPLRRTSAALGRGGGPA
jgi:hypothetical protein